MHAFLEVLIIRLVPLRVCEKARDETDISSHFYAVLHMWVLTYQNTRALPATLPA